MPASTSRIVTGDTPGTAKEIGRQIGTWKTGDTERNIITGPGFEALTDEEALDRVLDLKIMCRARPTDKQRLVQLLQQKGAVVAVTGDGTNDAPALKAAQVGLSMGDGTSVAKEASDITIIDNSFSSITRAVMWGRSLYRNIQKFLLFQLTINVAACLIVLLGSLLGTESPLTITQMLWVNLIMDTFAAGALASLPPNERVMKDKPRRSGKDGDFIITRPMAYNIFGVGLAFVIVLMGLLLRFHAQDGLTPHDLSWFFSFFVMLQFWNMFNAKAFMEDRSGIRQPEREQEFPDGGPAYHRRTISDRHVRRRNVQCRPVILERLGNHYRFDFSGSLDRRDRPVNRKMERINKKRGLRQKLTQPSSLTSKSLTEILTSCKSYTHKQPSHPTLLQYGATGCISPYGPNGSKNRF